MTLKTLHLTTEYFKCYVFGCAGCCLKVYTKCFLQETQHQVGEYWPICKQNEKQACEVKAAGETDDGDTYQERE